MIQKEAWLGCGDSIPSRPRVNQVLSCFKTPHVKFDEDEPSEVWHSADLIICCYLSVREKRLAGATYAMFGLWRREITS